MVFNKFLFLVTALLLSFAVFGADICSRTAVINFQEVLVDTNSNQKGEGLRYHLEKDPVAKKYLDTYQEGNKIKWYDAVPGSLGTLFILSGVLSNSSTGSRRALIIGGASLITINFLVSKTYEYKNESNLMNAVDEYNKRNIPRIYFNQSLWQLPTGLSVTISRSF